MFNKQREYEEIIVYERGYIMSAESIAKTIGIVVLSALMIILSFVFNERGEGNVSLILLFVGIILALILAASLFMNKQSS